MDSETVKVSVAGTTGIVSTLAGYAEMFNPIITAMIGFVSLIYICSKVYWLWKNKGEKK